MIREYYKIDEEAARQSRSMWSQTDYEPGSATKEYEQKVNEAYDIVERIEKERPRAAERAQRLANRYAKKLADNYNAGFRIEMMCPSILISGGGNFPVKKKEKQNQARDRNYEEYKKIEGYMDKLKNILYGNEVIHSGDEDAVDLLQEKLDKLTEKQSFMKATNSYYRKNKTLKGCPGITEETAIKLEKLLSDWQKEHKRVFEQWELQNNNSNIRSTKQRLERIKKEKEEGSTEISIDCLGLDVTENKEIMRIQFFFSGKPKPAVRDIMKRRSFRWSPKNGCWQRQITGNARHAAKAAIEEIKSLELEDIYDEI